MIAGYIVEIVFGPLGLIPHGRHAKVAMGQVTWNYTTYLNIAFLILAAVLVVRFARSGGMPMLKMMGGGADDMTGHDHSGHDHGMHAWSAHVSHNHAADSAAGAEGT